MLSKRVLFGALCAVAGLSGCAVEGNPNTIRIVGNALALRLDATANMCFPATGALFRHFGTLDLAVGRVAFNNYIYFAQIENRLSDTNTTNQSTIQQLRSDAASITLHTMTGELVSVTPLKGSLIAKAKLSKAAWSVPFNVEVKPGSTTVATVPIIPAAVSNEWANLFAAAPTRYSAIETAVIRIRLIGAMADSTVVETAPVEYPVAVCWGCLLNIPTFKIGPDITPKDQWKQCSMLKPSSDYKIPCVTGQDDYVDCGHYCQMCTAIQGEGGTACDPIFCPTLSDEELAAAAAEAKK